MLDNLLKRFPGKRVLVVGDVMLDEYLRGSAQRISAEAPVPIVELRERFYVPGGAANVAANVAGLCAEVILASIIGDDQAGRRLRDVLEARGIGQDGLLVATGRTTTTKTRVIAQNHQIARIDHEDRSAFPASLEQRLLAFIEAHLPSVDACILSDYNKGVVSTTLAQGGIQAATRLGKPVIVDPKSPDASRYRGATLVKPNLHEAELLLRRDIASPEDVTEAGHWLLDRLGCGMVLLTRGAEGMSLFQPGSEEVHIPTQAREVFDVTGAGDTVVSTLAVALAAGASSVEAAQLASHAAGIIVGRVGTSAIRFEDLMGRHEA